jgi:hypothetical protein
VQAVRRKAETKLGAPAQAFHKRLRISSMERGFSKPQPAIAA